MSRKLWTFPGGIHPPMHKEISNQTPIEKAPLPKRLYVPLHQHIGSSAKPLVKVGDSVLKGQKIGLADGYVSVPVHAPTSGTVVEIDTHPVPHPSGLNDMCVVIESDHKDQWIKHQAECDYHDMDPSHLRNLVREAGIVGLGGAGFPSFIKMNPGPSKKIDTLILNGIECEPYITCDDMLMREHAEDIIFGARVIAHAVQAETTVIAIEDNKPEAIECMSKACEHADDIEVVTCPTIYPQGSEKQLVKVITGKEVPSNSLPLDVSVVIHNVGTAQAVHRAIDLGEPLISRIVTMTGSGVKKPGNLDVLIGTPIEDLLSYCDASLDDIDRLIMGGPMMGFSLHTAKAPVIKTTNCILAATPQDLPKRGPTMPCIRCGACADSCPVSLLPQQLYWHARAKDFDKTQEYNLFDCIECGCCDYVCPSNIPLVHYYRYAKTEIWSREREKEKADLARHRHEFRLERIEREKLEKEEKRNKKKRALNAKTPTESADNAKQAAIAAAMQRVEAKKRAEQARDDAMDRANQARKKVKEKPQKDNESNE